MVKKNNKKKTWLGTSKLTPEMEKRLEPFKYKWYILPMFYIPVSFLHYNLGFPYWPVFYAAITLEALGILIYNHFKKFDKIPGMQRYVWLISVFAGFVISYSAGFNSIKNGWAAVLFFLLIIPECVLFNRYIKTGK